MHVASMLVVLTVARLRRLAMLVLRVLVTWELQLGVGELGGRRALRCQSSMMVVRRVGRRSLLLTWRAFPTRAPLMMVVLMVARVRRQAMTVWGVLVTWELQVGSGEVGGRRASRCRSTCGNGLRRRA